MNNGLTRRMGAIGLGMALCVGAGAYVTRATATGMLKAPPAAPTIATLDLQGIMTGLTERADKEKTFNAAGEEAQKRMKVLSTEIESDITKLESQPNTPAKIVAAKAVREKRLRAQAEAASEERALTELKADMIRDLYAKITDAAQKMAKQYGYQMVLASDQGVSISPLADLEGVQRSIALKRMLYVDPGLDITQDIVLVLNNDYATSGGKPAPTAVKKP